MNQKRVGILLSYFNLFVGMIVNIFLTPYLIYVLGDVDYSMYKVMQSFAGPLAMFHFGISTIVTRSIVRAKTIEDYTKEKHENAIALAWLSSAVLCVFIVIASIAMFCAIPSLYGGSYSSESIESGRLVFVCFVSATVFHMLTDVSSGSLIGHEKYVISSAIQFFKTIFKLIITVVFLKLGFGIIAVAMVDLIISVIVLIFSTVYSVCILKVIPKLHCFDKKQMIEILSFGIALLLQAFVNQINNSVDTMILGVYIDEKSIITMYSSALTIYAIYNSLISVVTTYFLPNATKLISQNASGKELTDFVIKPGRFQAIIAVACVLGFVLYGKDFIFLWIGEKYINAYWVTLILMVPVTIPLVENAVISILDASLKRVYRSIVLTVMAVLNIIVSIFLVQKIGFWGAAAGTALSLIIGHGILMNIYYAKTFKMQIFRMFYSIFKGILPCGGGALLFCLPLNLITDVSWIWFMVKSASFLLVYIFLLWLIGFDKTEKNIIKEVLYNRMYTII